jgi:hypothetical protein
MKTNNLPYLFALLTSICIIATLTSCIKKLKGNITVSGTIVEEYTQKPIPNIYLAIGESYPNGLGGYSPRVHVLSSYYTTDVNGNFNFSYETSDKIVAGLVIKDFNPLDSLSLKNIYTLKEFGTNYLIGTDKEFGAISLKENNTTNIKVVFSKNGRLKLNLLKNNSIAVDAIKVNTQYGIIVVKNDTSVYLNALPNRINKFVLTRNQISIWQDSIYFDNKGDTISRTVQL